MGVLVKFKTLFTAIVSWFRAFLRRVASSNRSKDQIEIHTAEIDGIERLYHWERFNEEFLRTSLRDRTIWCSNPIKFNDPWDRKPHYNTKLIEDPSERERHIQWFADVARRHNRTMTEKDIARMSDRMRADSQFMAEKIDEVSKGMWSALAKQYRVYCLGPDVSNLLMWSHYADGHK